ncbi:MAG: hypothetical protein ACYTF7_06275 [Planctomycetota bacterium]|jgi:hypothetical protein
MMRALLLRSISGPDHLRGVGEALISRGVRAERWFLEGVRERAFEGCAGVLLGDSCGPWAIEAIRRARAHGARVVQVLDGVCEWRNMHVSHARPGGFLHPAPVDTVCCAGAQDRIVLEHFGNRARATGLPRLAGATGQGGADARRVLVCSARRAWFTQAEREGVLGALDLVRRGLDRRGVEIVWRLSGEASDAMGVARSSQTLADDLARAGAVVTLPSTVLVESMLAGRPTMLLHPFVSPCWLPSVWRVGHEPPSATGIGRLDALHEGAYLGGECHRTHEGVDDVLDSLLDPVQSAMDAQRRVCSILHEGSGGAPEVCEAFVEACGADPGAGAMSGLATVARLPGARRGPSQGARHLRVILQPEHAGEVLEVECDACVVDPVWSVELMRGHVERALGLGVWDEVLVVDGRSERIVERRELESDGSFASRIVEGECGMGVSGFRDALEEVIRRGYRRVACFGVGRYTQRVVECLEESDPIVGYIDDGALEGERFLGRALVRPDLAIEALAPDCVLICSDAHAEQIMARCEAMVEAGVPVFDADSLLSGGGGHDEIKATRDGHDGLCVAPTPLGQSDD